MTDHELDQWADDGGPAHEREVEPQATVTIVFSDDGEDVSVCLTSVPPLPADTARMTSAQLMAMVLLERASRMGDTTVVRVEPGDEPE